MSRIWTGALPFFSERELRCKGTGIIKLDIRFATALPQLRLSWGRPMNPNSVCRAPAHNLAVGGRPNSWHLTENPERPSWGCMSIDTQWRDWPVADKLAFARLAWKLGWAVGLHDGFCHTDRRGDCPGWNQTVFIYGTWSWPFGPSNVYNQ